MNGRKEEGVVVSFDAAKGFGFIRSKSIREEVFVHKLSVVGAGTLRPGRRVTFEVEASDRGPRASQVEVGGRGLAPGQAPAILLLLALIAATCGLHRIGLGPFGAYLVAINLATWPVYAWDKRQAGREERRVPEAVLLGLALFGGSPAAALAMRVLHHKTRKPSFFLPFIGVVVLQVVGIAVVVSARTYA